MSWKSELSNVVAVIMQSPKMAALSNAASTAMQSPKIAMAVSGGTITTGASTWLDMIPDDIGKLATMAGLLLSSVLIYNHASRGRLERDKLRLEIDQLKSGWQEGVHSDRRKSPRPNQDKE